MTNFISIFPLPIVVFPYEDLNLHIFEPRYIQLINECTQSHKPFGIPVVIHNQIKEMGTLLEITQISKRYETGEMNIKTRGTHVFRILEITHEIPGKLYSGAIVTYPENQGQGNQTLMKKIITATQKLHQILRVKKPLTKSAIETVSYDIAHSVGLNLEEEFELLTFMSELHRQEYLRRHLAKVLPIMQEMESLKEKIKLNGHFKDYTGIGLS